MISRAVYPKRRGRRYLSALAAASLVVGTLVIATTVQAVHDEGVFQMDGNAVTDSTTTNPPNNPGTTYGGTHDWDQVYQDRNSTTYPNSGAEAQTFVADFFGAGDNILFGGSTKDVSDLPDWQWKQTATTSVQDKDDIEHAFAAQYNVDKSGVGEQCGSVTGSAAANCILLYFGADRYSNSGDTTMGFWFYQRKVELSGPDSGGLGGFTKQHTARSATGHGDILVVADFLTGGKAPTVSVYEWVDSGGSASTHLDLIAGGTSDPADCTEGAAPKQNATPVPPVGNNDNYCATTNAFVVTSPWSFTPKPNSGGTAGVGGAAQFGISEFMEGGINLTALGLGNECFSSFLAETRASHSPTSTLSDFALGNFGSCSGSMDTTPSSTSFEIGGSVTDDATINVSGVGANPPAPTGTVDFYVCGPEADLASCDDSGTNFSSVDLSTATQNGNEYTVTSGSFTPTSAGDYCFFATWAGDSNYEDGASHDGDNECFTVTPRQPSISTSQTASVTLGSPISDTATLGDTADQPDGSPAGGTITFYAYGPQADPSTPVCSGTAAYTSPAYPVSGDDIYPTATQIADATLGAASFTPSAAGTYEWIAVYSGDPPNTKNVSSICGDEASVVIQLQPSMTTSQWFYPNDSATVTVASGGDNLNGSVRFRLYTTSDCSGEALVDQTKAVSGALSVTVDTTNTTVKVQAPPATTNLYWLVEYTSSNTGHKSIAGVCGDENSTITIDDGGTLSSPPA